MLSGDDVSGRRQRIPVLGTYEETKHHWPDEKEEEAEKDLPPETVEEPASLEDQIAGLEEEGARLQKELENAPSSEVERLKQKKQKLDARLEALYESWLEEAAE